MHAMLVAVLVLLCTAGLVAELTGSPLDVLDGPQARQSDLEYAHLDSLGLLGALSGTDLHSFRHSLKLYSNT